MQKNILKNTLYHNIKHNITMWLNVIAKSIIFVLD
jgi:hypothetical protein